MSVNQQHQEWLQLLEISGPFLAMPVIARTFPQGLERVDTASKRELRLAYHEWLSSHSNEDDARKYHLPWIKHVLKNLLEYPAELFLEGEQLPSSLAIDLREHGEVLKPDLVLASPNESKPRVLISVVAASQKLDRVLTNKPSHSKWLASPATRMMEMLRRSSVEIGLVTNGEHWMLVYAPQSDTISYVGWYSSVWMEEELTVRAFRALLSAYRLFGVPKSETLESLFKASTEFQHEVTTQLGLQVRRAIEQLIQALDQIDKDSRRTLLQEVSEFTLYEAGVSVMMRLVFLLTAEERELFPVNNQIYRDNYAVITLREQLEELAAKHGEEVLERRYDAWNRLLATFRAIYAGVRHEDFDLPAYGGSLFDPDRYPFLEGRAPDTVWHETSVVPLPVNDRTVLHLLESLQLLRGSGQKSDARKLSFRALDVEQIGHVYESLLEHTAVRAEDLVLGLEGSQGKEPEVPVSKLKYHSLKGENEFLQWLHDETGKSSNALQKLLKKHDRYPDYKVRAVCDNQDTLYSSVRPFVGLVREDSQSMPVIFTPGSIYVTEGSERRSSGTHYTPKSLTESIVKETLDPIIYRDMVAGVEPTQQNLRSPSELLGIKICDVTCGSGAFLVQACRYLAEKLVEAWAVIRSGLPNKPIDIYGNEISASGDQNVRFTVPQNPDDCLLFARRLIADRCLYGVDCNEMAVEMAKLSVWLITLQRDRPFTFLDHAIKCGDSLVGVSTLDELQQFSLIDDSSALKTHIFANSALPFVSQARERRQKLEALPALDICDNGIKEKLSAEADRLVKGIEHVADILVALTFRNAGDTASLKREVETKSLQLAALITSDSKLDNDWANVVAIKQSLIKDMTEQKLNFVNRRPLHWPLVFPEVFLRENPGFDAIIGNPPMLWGNRISSRMGMPYRDFLMLIHAKGNGNADLCSHFFLRMIKLLRQGGTYGLIATNSIKETDTRAGSLEVLASSGFDIYAATSELKWPGKAALFVSIVHAIKGEYNAAKKLDGRIVQRISTRLDSTEKELKPYRLTSNLQIAFKGVDTGGLGFVVEESEQDALCCTEPNTAERIWPLINGDDFVSTPNQQPTRRIINLSGLTLEQASANYPSLLNIVQTRVKPYRDGLNEAGARNKWWLYKRTCPALYEAIEGKNTVLVNCVVAKYLAFEFLPSRMVFTNALNVFALDSIAWFGLLQSTIHEVWAYYFGSSLETRPRYNPTDCFETFPVLDSDFQQNAELVEAAQAYYDGRKLVMLQRNIGLTELYNLIHDREEGNAEIKDLRRLHAVLDRVVANCYGWSNLVLDHDFTDVGNGVRFTLSKSCRREILDRLFKLNIDLGRSRVIDALNNDVRSTSKTPTRAAEKSEFGK